METLLPFALLCFTSFFTLTNPLGTMPVFLTMTHGMTDKERRAIVRRATIVSFLTLMVFVFAGQLLFKFFGISTNGFRIAGGVIIFKIGFDMLQARYTPMKLKDEETRLPFFARRFCFAIGTAKTVFYFKVSCSPSYSCAVGSAPIAGIFFL